MRRPMAGAAKTWFQIISSCFFCGDRVLNVATFSNLVKIEPPAVEWGTPCTGLCGAPLATVSLTHRAERHIKRVLKPEVSQNQTTKFTENSRDHHQPSQVFNVFHGCHHVFSKAGTVLQQPKQESLRLRVLRAPHVDDLPQEPLPKLLVGAPLKLGDVILYDAGQILGYGLGTDMATLAMSQRPYGMSVHIHIKIIQKSYPHLYWLICTPGKGPTKTAWVLKRRRPLRATSSLSEAKTKDSRIIHWGMANTENSPRHVLYLLLVP